MDAGGGSFSGLLMTVVNESINSEPLKTLNHPGKQQKRRLRRACWVMLLFVRRTLRKTSHSHPEGDERADFKRGAGAFCNSVST